MEAAKSRKKTVKGVKMIGTGNFYIGEYLYPFNDGDIVKPHVEEHRGPLEAESKRRERVAERQAAIEAASKA